MKPKLSPLRLIDFAVINSSFHFTGLGDNQVELSDLYNEYSIDIDFAFIEDEDPFHKAYVKAEVNFEETKLPGYSIFAEGVAIFSVIDGDALSPEDKNSLLQYSAVSIALNSLRGFIATLTANAPFGRYVLPSIDVNDLFKQKSADQDKVKKTKKGNK